MRRPWRTTAWSSAIRTRITAAPRARRSCPRPGASRCSACRRARGRAPPSTSGPSRRERSAGLVGVEADAVVGDRDAQVAVVRVEADVDAARRRRGAARSAAPPGRCAAPRRRRRRGSASPSTLERDCVAVHASAARRRACAARRRGPRSRPPAGAARRSASAAPPSPRARAPAGAAAGPCASSGSRSSRWPPPRRSSASAEELLRDRVVQLAREPVALLDDAQLAAALVEAGVLDRERGVGGEHLDELLVGLVELLGADLVGEVEGADDPAGARRSARRGTSASAGAPSGHQPRKRGSRRTSLVR